MWPGSCAQDDDCKPDPCVRDVARLHILFYPQCQRFPSLVVGTVIPQRVTGMLSNRVGLWGVDKTMDIDRNQRTERVGHYLLNLIRNVHVVFSSFPSL